MDKLLKEESTLIKIAGAIGVIIFPILMLTEKVVVDAGNIYIVALYTALYFCYLIPNPIKVRGRNGK